MLVGEHGVSDTLASMFLEEALGESAVMRLARRYHGLAILWEHRFYGASLPFPLDNETGLAVAGYDAYKYLTNEQVRCFEISAEKLTCSYKSAFCLTSYVPFSLLSVS